MNVIKLLLLIGCQQRTNLRCSAIHDRFYFLHRLLMDRGDLRFRLINDRLNLGLLIGSKVQLLGHSFKRKSAPMPSAAAAMVGLSLHHGKAAERDGREESCRLHFLFLDSAEELVTVIRQLFSSNRDDLPISPGKRV